jgi:hypothetical protein
MDLKNFEIKNEMKRSQTKLTNHLAYLILSLKPIYSTHFPLTTYI